MSLRDTGIPIRFGRWNTPFGGIKKVQKHSKKEKFPGRGAVGTPKSGKIQVINTHRATERDTPRRGVWVKSKVRGERAISFVK